MALGRPTATKILERVIVLMLAALCAAVLLPKFRRQIEISKMSNMLWAVFRISEQAEAYIIRNPSGPDFSGLTLDLLKPGYEDWRYRLKGSPSAGRYVVEAQRKGAGGYSICARKASPDVPLCWTCVKGEGHSPLSDMTDSPIRPETYCAADASCAASCAP